MKAEGSKERPKDLRRALSAAFIKALLLDFERHGAEVIARVFGQRPLAICEAGAPYLKSDDGPDDGPERVDR
jgi:hypothetical protein